MTWKMERAALHRADARKLPVAANSVHTIVTSPPYLGLRDYNVQPAVWDAGIADCEHQWVTRGKARKNETAMSRTYCTIEGCGAWRGVYGTEPSIEEYLQHTVEIFRELRRVLRRDGTLWLNIADSYNTRTNSRTYHRLNADGTPNRSPKDPKVKDLLLMPARVTQALQEDGWYVRSENIWAKDTGRPDAPEDRPRVMHEQVYLLTQSPKYFYDPEAVKTPGSPNTHARRKDGQYRPAKGTDANDRRTGTWTQSYVPETVNLTTVWRLQPNGTGDEHFAAFPTALADTCILAGTSAKGSCPQCGAQWTRVGEGEKTANSPLQMTMLETDEERNQSKEEDWAPGCGHGLKPVPATVLDPFCGTGTTVCSAVKLGRIGIGTDASEAYLQTAQRRLSLMSRPMVIT